MKYIILSVPVALALYGAVVAAQSIQTLAASFGG